MASEGSSGAVSEVHRLKQEIDRLNELQAKVLKSATYVGMTPDEATEYEVRRSRITQLVRELAMLTHAQ